MSERAMSGSNWERGPAPTPATANTPVPPHGALRVVTRDEGPGRSTSLLYNGTWCVGWSTTNCGPAQVIARAFEEAEAWLRAKAARLFPPDPDFVVQEAVVRAITAADRLWRDASPFWFLERIMLFVASDLRRRDARRRVVSLDDVPEQDTPTVELPPLELAEEERARLRLARRLLDELPPAEREAVQLLDVEGLTVAEAACRSGRTEAALQKARSRGRCTLRRRAERFSRSSERGEPLH